MKKRMMDVLFMVCVILNSVSWSVASSGEATKKYIDVVIPVAPPHLCVSSIVGESDVIVQGWHDAIAKHKVAIDDGKAIMCDISTRDFTRNPASLYEARAVIWHLFASSVNAGHGFCEGTWVICGKKDVLEKITSFFMSANDPNGLVAAIKNRIIPDKKRRISSHFSEWKAKHYGIDVSDLPLGKKHILFSSPVDISGCQDEQKIYLKIENYGVSTFTDFIFHTKEYIGLEDRRHQYFRKEKLPQSVKKIWLHYAPLIGIKAHDIQQGLKLGICKMKALLATIPAHLSVPEPLHQAIVHYHHQAKGNEVVIDLVTRM